MANSKKESTQKSNKQYLLSVILPTYNRSFCISDAIRSIMGQQYEKWELVIVDDCSTDDTQELLKFWTKQDKRIRVIKNKKNLGVGASRNVGARAAKGEILVVQDSDDVMLINRLGEINAVYNKDKFGIFYSDFMQGDMFCNPKMQVSPGEFKDDMLIMRQEVPHLTMAYPRSLALKIPYKEIRTNDDWFFLVDAYNSGAKFSYAPVATMIKRDFPTGLSLTSRKQYNKDFKNYTINPELRKQNEEKNT